MVPLSFDSILSAPVSGSSPDGAMASMGDAAPKAGATDGEDGVPADFLANLLALLAGGDAAVSGDGNDGLAQPADAAGQTREEDLSSAEDETATGAQALIPGGSTAPWTAMVPDGQRSADTAPAGQDLIETGAPQTPSDSDGTGPDRFRTDAASSKGLDNAGADSSARPSADALTASIPDGEDPAEGAQTNDPLIDSAELSDGEPVRPATEGAVLAETAAASTVRSADSKPSDSPRTAADNAKTSGAEALDPGADEARPGDIAGAGLKEQPSGDHGASRHGKTPGDDIEAQAPAQPADGEDAADPLALEAVDGEDALASETVSRIAHGGAADGDRIDSTLDPAQVELTEGEELAGIDGQVKAAEKTEESEDTHTAPRSRATGSGVVSQLVNRASLMIRNGQSEMHIDLKPETLGRISMRIATENQRVSVHVVAENAAARDAIESNLGQLRADLAVQGIEIDSFDVEMMASNDSDRQEANPGGAGQGGFGPSFQGGPVSTATASTAESGMTELSGNRSVDYFA